jgi:hypothetical protein
MGEENYVRSFSIGRFQTRTSVFISHFYRDLRFQAAPQVTKGEAEHPDEYG